MRIVTRMLAAGLLIALALPAASQTPAIGSVTDDCTTIVNPAAGEPAELLALKIDTLGDCSDFLFDLRATGGLVAGGADASTTVWAVPPNWRASQASSDTEVVILTYPAETPTGGNRIAIDAEDTATQDFAMSARQTIGDSIPSAYVGVGLAGIDLVLPGAPVGYSVKLDGPASRVQGAFPMLAGSGNVLSAIEYAFAPLAEVNDVDWTGNACSVAARVPNQAGTSPTGNDGAILGYNVYRVRGTAAVVPTRADFFAASIDTDPETGWQYFLPVTSSFVLDAPDPSPGAPGTPSPIDSNPNDLGGLQNPDGVFGSGDEVMIFQDSAANRGVPRITGTAPVHGVGYWYATQPVLCGSVARLASVSFGFGQFGGDHASSVAQLGPSDDAIDLDLDGSIDFFSPQADYGLPGLGLTYDSLPALSAPAFTPPGGPLPAFGEVSLSGEVAGRDINIVFQTGLQAGDVEGFNVYRGTDDTGVRVNEQLILSQGQELSAYRLVDDAVQARRVARGGTLEYVVEIVYSDGWSSLVGPFEVTVGRQAPARRSR